MILDVLDKLIKSDGQGNYSREGVIRSLLIPMRTDSNKIGTDASNLWIIDERLAIHEYLASDKTLKSMPITGSESTRSPTCSRLGSSTTRCWPPRARGYH